MNKWLELAAKCEAATGPDREIDIAILIACGWVLERRGNDRKEWLYPVGAFGFRQNPFDLDAFVRVTRSLDAITVLIERELPVSAVKSGRSLSGASWATIYWAPKQFADGLSVDCGALTEPLARCAAFCRAMAAKSPEETPETASADCK